MEESKDYEKRWDESAQMSYMVNEKDSSFISYEDEKVVRMKAEYAIKKKAAGIIIWDISGDYIAAKKGALLVKDTPLAGQIKEVFELNPGQRIAKKY